MAPQPSISRHLAGRRPASQAMCAGRQHSRMNRHDKLIGPSVSPWNGASTCPTCSPGSVPQVARSVAGSVFGSAATIMVETLNWATVVLESTIARYRIVLEIDDQILKYESKEYSRAREKRNRNQLRREQVMKQASDSVKDFLESDSFKEALRGASRDLAKDERVKEAVKSGSRAVVDALKRHKWR